MENVNDYLETAIVVNDLKNHTALAEKLKITRSAISTLKRGKSLPSPETMIKLAGLCEIPPEIALCDLGRWSENEEVSTFYENIAKIVHKGLNGIAALFLLSLCYSFSFSNNEAKAETISCNSCDTNSHAIYYGK